MDAHSTPFLVALLVCGTEVFGGVLTALGFGNDVIEGHFCPLHSPVTEVTDPVPCFEDLIPDLPTIFHESFLG